MLQAKFSVGFSLLDTVLGAEHLKIWTANLDPALTETSGQIDFIGA